MCKTDDNKFNLTRISFAVLDGKCVHTMFDERSHKEWLEQVYGVRGRDYEDTIRGYLKDGKAYFYKSSHFSPIDMRDVGVNTLNHLHILSMVYMNTGNVMCYNGLKHTDGTSVWEPIITLGDLKQLIDQRSVCCKGLSD